MKDKPPIDCEKLDKMYQEAQAKRAGAKTKDEPRVGYKEMFKKYQAAKKAQAKADDLTNKGQTNTPDTNPKKTKPFVKNVRQGVAGMKTVLIKNIIDIKGELIKWTIIILIAACAFYLVSPKYYFSFPTNNLYKANKVTGTVEIYNRNKGRWQPR